MIVEPVESALAGLARFAPTLAIGSTVLLALGVLACSASRSPVQGRRCAVTTVLVFLAWLLLAAVPLPRPQVLQLAAPAEEVVAETAPPQEPVGVETAWGESGVSARLTPVAPEATISREDVVAPLAAGSLVLGVYLLLAWIVLCRRIARTRPAPEPVRRLATELGFDPQRSRILMAVDPTRPFCFGLRTSTVVLPAGLGDPAQRERLQAVLLHELGHVRGADPRDQVLFALCMPLLYWHPLFWMLRRRLRLCAELIADDFATRRVDRGSYVRELIGLVDRPARSLATAPGLPVLGLESEFYRRMKMLLTRDCPLPIRCSRLQDVLRRCAAALLLAGLTFGMGVPELPAQEDAPGVAPQGKHPPHRFELAGSYPSAEHLEKLLLYLDKNGFTTAGLRLSTGDGGQRRYTLEIRTAGGAGWQKRWDRLQKDFTGMGVEIQSYRPRPGSKEKRMKTVDLSVDDTDIRKVIASIAAAAGANIVVAPDVKGEVTLRLAGVPWRDALEIACLSVGNTEVRQEGGILRVVRRNAEQMPRVYFAFKDAPIEQVIDTIAKISGANIVISPKVRGKLTLRLKNVPWRDALDAACKTLGFTVVTEDRGILRVVPGR